MKRLNVGNRPSWNVAKKTKAIRAKPLISIMVDRTVLSKFLVDTLEGKEPLGDGVVICIGDSNDAWQQMPNKLLAKYDVSAIDNDGWMICEPKPDNAVDCFEVRSTDDGDTEFFVIGQWGEDSDEGPRQFGTIGDFVCRNRTDPTDVWIVRRKIFLNTYNIMD